MNTLLEELKVVDCVQQLPCLQYVPLKEQVFFPAIVQSQRGTLDNWSWKCVPFLMLLSDQNDNTEERKREMSKQQPVASVEKEKSVCV